MEKEDSAGNSAPDSAGGSSPPDILAAQWKQIHHMRHENICKALHRVFDTTSLQKENGSLRTRTTGAASKVTFVLEWAKPNCSAVPAP